MTPEWTDPDRPGPRSAYRLDRRRMLGLMGFAGIAVFTTACRGGDGGSTATDATSPGGSGPQGSTAGAVTPAPDTPTLEPTVRDLKLRLTAAPAEATIVAGRTSPVLRYRAEVLEGDPASVAASASASYLGPTLHLRAGQRVRITYQNDLEQESIVHWHGLPVPQGQDGQPSDAVAAGARYEYDFVVPDRPGTFWYHPHPHHLTGEQVYRGLAGLLIVHGDEPEALTSLPDLPLVLQDRTVAGDGTLRYAATMHDSMAGFVGDTLVTNGVAGYEVAVERRAYRVRLLNGANSRTQHLVLSTGDDLVVVATDGCLLPEARTVPALVLTPAQRSDLWLDFSGAEPGARIELRAADTFVESGGGMGMGMGGGGGGGGTASLTLDHRVAATFVVAEGGDDVRPTRPGRLDGVIDVDPSRAVNAATPKRFVLSTRMASHWINDRQWEGRVATDLETVTAGTTELWEFENRSPMAHPMHLHGLAFRVVERSWADPAAAASWAVIADGVVEDGLRDTVLVWPGQVVRLAVRFNEHRGYFPYHCHILEHEDGGMMRNFHVV